MTVPIHEDEWTDYATWLAELTAKGWPPELIAVVKKRSDRHDVMRMAVTWKPPDMALVTFLLLATGRRYRGRRYGERRIRNWGVTPEGQWDHRSYSDDRRGP